MAQVIVRNLDETLVDRFKQVAKRRDHFLEQDFRDILAVAAKPCRAKMIAKMDRIRAMTPRKIQSHSTDLIRQDPHRGWD